MSKDQQKIMNGNRVVETARQWIGTPYLHQQSVCGMGCDCLGLIRGVWRTLIGREPEEAPDYSSDWGEVSGREIMLDAARRNFIEIDKDVIEAGAVLVFRWQAGTVAKHAGILTEENRFIHAYEKAGVVETTLGRFWQARIEAAFLFPAHMR